MKKLVKSLQHIGYETKRDYGRTWHSDLEDKPHAIRAHVSCLKNCAGDAENFRISTLSITTRVITLDVEKHFLAKQTPPQDS